MKPTVVYVSSDVERALLDTPSTSFRIITASSVHARGVSKQFPSFVSYIEGVHDTYGVLTHPKTAEILKDIPDVRLMVFKPDGRIERFCEKNGWKLINPSSDLAKSKEEKISQTAWLDGLGSTLLMPHTVCTLSDVKSVSLPAIIQFNTGHTGNGTQLVSSVEELEILQKQFPNRLVRISQYVSGPTYTINAVVDAVTTHIGPVMYQITGLAPFTDLPYATIGNDWHVPSVLLTPDQQLQCVSIIEVIGRGLHTLGWRGCFGIDVVVDTEKNKVYVIEVNMRQTASVSFESSLQRMNGSLSTGQAHIAALLGETINTPLPSVTNGAQLIQRVTKKIQKVDDAVMQSIRDIEGVSNIISYDNTDHNESLLRIQSEVGFMQGHNTLNTLGEKVRDVILHTYE